MQIYPRLLSADKTKVRINKSLFWGGYYFVYPAGWTWNITTRFAVKHLNEIDLHEKKKVGVLGLCCGHQQQEARIKAKQQHLEVMLQQQFFFGCFFFLKLNFKLWVSDMTERLR